MKKRIGNALALYPTPLVVVGTMVDGKPNWCGTIIAMSQSGCQGSVKRN